MYTFADAEGLNIGPAAQRGTLFDYDYETCQEFFNWRCNNINKTNITVNSGGSGAPFIGHIRQVLLSPPAPKAQGHLEISRFSVSPGNAVCGSTTKFRLAALVENTGSSSEEGVVEFYSGGQKIGSAAIPKLGPGEVTGASVSWEGVLHSDTVFAAMSGSSSRSFMVKDPATCIGSVETIFPESIIRTHELSDNLSELTKFVEDSATWYETCICCGVINATKMLNTTGRPSSLKSIVLMSDGKANAGCAGLTPRMTGDAVEDAINASCEAFEKYGLRVYTVGFGIDVNESTLTQMAQCGGGQYYNATDTSKLMDAYRAIAATLLNLSYKNQVLEATGAQKTTIYPDSYLEFTFTPKKQELGYREFVVTSETENFSSCDGSFVVPQSITPFDVKVLSYSADRWTKEVTFTNETGSAWTVFNLSDFGSTYQKFGDPYVIEFDPTDPLPPGAKYPGIITPGLRMRVNVSTGSSPSDLSTDCPNRNKVIYKSTIGGSVPFSPVLPSVLGRNVLVYYDLRQDEGYASEPVYPPEGSILVPIGLDLPNVPFNSTPINVSDFAKENETNALAYTFISMMDQLNYYKMTAPKCTLLEATQDPAEGPVCCNDPAKPGYLASGSKCNPIDLKITSDLITRSVAINRVPYMYGPVDIGVVTWTKQEGG